MDNALFLEIGYQSQFQACALIAFFAQFYLPIYSEATCSPKMFLDTSSLILAPRASFRVVPLKLALGANPVPLARKWLQMLVSSLVIAQSPD